MILDTHVWLWYIQGDRRLPRTLQGAINSDPSSVFVSPISAWECLMLASKGRIQITGDPTEFVRGAFEEMEFIEAPLTVEIVVLSRELSFDHEDPADRFLAATAVHYGLPLATVDDRLRQLPWLKTVS